jgi:hypothetical protein
MDRLERRMGRPADPPEPVVSSPAPQAESTPVITPPADGGEAAGTVEETGIEISLDQLRKVWPGLFGSLSEVLGARRWALFREATPAEVSGRTIVLEVTHDFHLTALEQDDAVARIVATKAGDLLGGPVKVVFRSRNSGPPRSEEERIDLAQLEERPETETNPETLLAAELGARVVDE